MVPIKAPNEETSLDNQQTLEKRIVSVYLKIVALMGAKIVKDVRLQVPPRPSNLGVIVDEHVPDQHVLLDPSSRSLFLDDEDQVQLNFEFYRNPLFQDLIPDLLSQEWCCREARGEKWLSVDATPTTGRLMSRIDQRTQELVEACSIFHQALERARSHLLGEAKKAHSARVDLLQQIQESGVPITQERKVRFYRRLPDVGYPRP